LIILQIPAPTLKYLRDRIFMIMGTNNTYQDSEKIPKMASLSIEFTEDSFTLSCPYKDPITVKVPEDSPGTRRECR
jgi:hypothetical protein